MSVTIRRGLNWILDLLTTYTHDSELQAVTAPPLISTIHKPPRHPLSLFQPAVSTLAVPWQRLLTAEILRLHAVRSYLQSLPYQNSTELIAPTVLVITSRHGPHRKHSSSTVAFVSIAAGTCLPSCCPETAASRITENTVLLFFRACCGRYLVTAAVYRATT
jgi:hypothetical protein